MLKLVNFCCHGYVAIPVIEACHKQGLFTLVDGNKFRKRGWLIRELKANAGYFSVALQALESLGWLEKNEKDAYRLTPSADSYLFNLDLTSLYATDPESLLRQASDARHLAKKIDSILLKDPVRSAFAGDLVKGAFIPPLVAGLKYLDNLSLENEGDNFCEALTRLDRKLALSIEKLFVRQNWLAADKSHLTPEGKQLLQTEVLGSIVDHRPLLYAMRDLLFGGKPQVETGAKRTPQAGVQQEIRAVFDQFPADKKPRVVADIGSGRRSLLREACQRVWPEADYLSIPGTVNKAGDTGKALVDIGSTPETEILYIHTFPDENLTVDPELPLNESLAPLAAGELEYYLDEHAQLLDALTVLNHWQRHLQDWADGLGQSGLLVHAMHNCRPGKHLNTLTDRRAFIPIPFIALPVSTR